MQGSSGIRRGLVHLVAGAALGAGVVLVLWMLSGGKPFGEVVGTGDVSAPTPAAAEKTPIQVRTGAPAASRARLEKAPPALGRGSGQLKFSKPAAKTRPAAKAERKPRRARARRKAAVRVVAPPAEPAEQLPVAVVPSPAPTAVPAPPAPAPSGGAGKPVRRRAPALSVGAGEG
jgi:hypothetical protein